MTKVCGVCLHPIGSGPREYHAKCMRKLFSSSEAPTLALNRQDLHLLGQAMAGKVTVSGVQQKLALVRTDRATLSVSDGGRSGGPSYILKPDTGIYPDLPVNEQLCSQLAQLVGITVPPSGLLRLRDGSLAFLSRRFDRTDSGEKVAVEDFCQLAEKLPREKYQGSTELCAKLIAKYSTQPAVDGAQLFRLFLFSWWIGNGDLHLKNLSLLRLGGRTYMAPAYDLVSTAIVIPGDLQALTLAGKKSNFTAEDWLDLASRCRVPERVVAVEVRSMMDRAGHGLELILQAPMDMKLKLALARLWVERAKQISEVALEALGRVKRLTKPLRGPVAPTAEQLVRCVVELRSAFGELGLTSEEFPFQDEMQELEWAGQGDGDLFRSDGPAGQDATRMANAFRSYLRLKAIAEFVTLASSTGAKEENTIKHAKRAELNAGWVRGHSGNRLFELEVASALHSIFPGQISLCSEAKGPDILFLQDDGPPFGIECKRPAKLNSVLAAVRKGVKQLARVPGIVLVSLDPVIQAGWIQADSYAACVETAQRELRSLLSPELRKALMAELQSSLGADQELMVGANGVVVIALFGVSWPGPNGMQAVRYHLATETIAHQGVLKQLVDEVLVGALRFSFDRALR